jgi:hypothetical protein
VTAVVRGDFSETDGRILATLASALLAGPTIVAGLALVERGRRALGWLAVVLAIPGFALLAYAIWSFVFDGGEDDAWRWGWTGALLLAMLLVAVTAQLIARGGAMIRLAWATGALTAAAGIVSIAAIWAENPDDTLGRTLAVLWILAGLTYLLVPVLQRFSNVGAGETPVVRVLGELDGVQLVASRGALEGVEVEPPVAGERLVLRRQG